MSLADYRIRPALTEEEWGDGCDPQTTLGDNPKMGIFSRAFVRPTNRTENGDNVASPEVVEIVFARAESRPGHENRLVLDDGDRLALAAICLAGHRQGFTEGDVALLDEAGGAALLRLRDRIAALLPPRE